MTNREEKYQRQMYAHLARQSQAHIAEYPTKYMPRQQFARQEAMSEIFKLVRKVKGSIIDAGVFHGFSTFTWAQLMACHCPYMYQDVIYAFDTWTGFPELGEMDTGKDNPELIAGAFGDVDLNEQKECARLFQLNHPLHHTVKMEFIKGDVNKTVPKFIENNQHIVVRLMYLDLDLHEPTVTMLQNFIPRMSKGSVIVFDEVGNSRWPGETMAMLEGFNLTENELRCFEYEPNMSYMIL